MDLRQCLGLANYLHKHTKDYAGSIQPLSSLLKRLHVVVASRASSGLWCSEKEPGAIPRADSSRRLLFHVVCAASDFAIGYALM